MVHDGSYSQLELMQARVKLVPDGWAFNYVGKTFAIKNNLRKPISEDEREKNPGVYPYYGPTKIQGYIGTYEQDGSYALIGEDGDHFLKYESQPMTQLVDGKCTVNNHAHIIEGTKKASREWFYYYFMHRDIFSFLSRQGAGRYKLNKASLEKIPVLVPPVQEQKKIAQILSTWDKAITTTEQLLANSQQQKKALMQQLLSGKKRLLDKNGVRLSGEWKSYELGDWIREYNEKSVSSDQHEVLTSSRGGLVKQSEYFADSRISQRDNIGFNVIPPGYITYRSRSDDGQFFFNRNELSFTGIISTYYPVFHFPEGDSTFFLNYLNRSSSAFAGYSVGTSQKVLSLNALKAIKARLPKKEEQQKIAAVLSAADQEISALQQKLDALKLEKKALMQQLLTGKRRVVIE